MLHQSVVVKYWDIPLLSGFCVPQGAGFLPSTIWILGLKLGSYPIEPFFTTQISNLHPSNISNQQGCWFSQNGWIKNTSVLFVPKKDCSSWAIYIYTSNLQCEYDMFRPSFQSKKTFAFTRARNRLNRWNVELLISRPSYMIAWREVRNNKNLSGP